MRIIQFLARLPGRIRFIFLVLALDLVLYTALRLAFLGYFRPVGADYPAAAILRALELGLRFDARLAVAVLLPFLLLSRIPWIDPARGERGRNFWLWYLTAAQGLVLLVYLVDFATYGYIHNRVNATLLSLTDNAGIGWGMVWQTYPVVRLALLWLAILAAYRLILRALALRAMAAPRPAFHRRWTRPLLYVICFLLLAAIGYGKVSRYPLRWSDAFTGTDTFVSQLALNPVLFLAESFREHQRIYDPQAVREAYPLLADYFRVPDPDPKTLSLRRPGIPHQRIQGEPNIVIILMETFAAFKVGATGNPLDPTPRFDALAQDGLLFTRFYTPMENTSRSLFSLLTGVPDVSRRFASTRNPLVVRQHSILNALAGHDKLYFLGGSANWGNIRGMLMHNIKGLRIYEEGSYTSPVHDVWGISDADLFEEANKVLRGKRERPFLAVIQTSGNHRPFRIPEDPKGFRPVPLDERKLAQNGFYSLAEYNGLRFLDHCLGYYLDLARKEDYFADTLFIVMGDHGTTGGSVKRDFGNLNLDTNHVPLLFYAPRLIGGGKTYDRNMSELDLLPTLASFLGKPYVNQTLGRDVFDPAWTGPSSVFTFTAFQDPPRLGLLEDDFFVNVEPDGKSELWRLRDPAPAEKVTAARPEQAARMARLARAFHSFAEYLLANNPPVEESR